MKLSSKEKFLLCVLGTIVLSYGYFEIVHVNLGGQLQERKNEKSRLEDKYNNAINTINALDERKDEKDLLSEKILDKTSVYYPTISQEHIIIELNKMLQKSSLNGTYKFNSVSVGSVENMEKKEDTFKKSSFNNMANKYKNIEENKDTNDKSVSINSNNDESLNSESTSESSNKENTNSNNNSKNENNKNTVEQLKCELTFKGTYENLDEFLKLINENERKIIATDINVSQKSLDEITGSMNLEFYALPKIDDEIINYLHWDSDDEYGKDNPFSASSTTTKDKKKEEDKDLSDFNVSIRSNTSVMSSVVIGRSKDDFKNTYVYSDSDTEESAEIVLSQKDDKYYYKYKTSKESYPNDYTSVGKEFVPSLTSNIVINVSSEGRVDNEDNSSLNLKVVNETDLLAVVNIKDDDKDNPRVKVYGDGSHVNVNTK